MQRILVDIQQLIEQQLRGWSGYLRMPAFKELPMMSVVQPAYHARPNGGQGSFCPSGSRRLSCVLVFATAPSSEDSQLKSGLIHQPTFGRICNC